MKLYLIGIIMMFSGASMAQDAISPKTVERDSVILFAKQFLGTPYKYGGSSKNGFDCSGFVHYIFSHFKISVPRSSRDFKGQGTKVELNQANPGDVILFTGTNSAIREIGHVGIVLKNVNGTVDFIHSSSSKNHWGVTITRYNDSGYLKRFMGVIDIL